MDFSKFLPSFHIVCVIYSRRNYSNEIERSKLSNSIEFNHSIVFGNQMKSNSQ